MSAPATPIKVEVCIIAIWTYSGTITMSTEEFAEIEKDLESPASMFQNRQADRIMQIGRIDYAEGECDDYEVREFVRQDRAAGGVA